MSDDDVDPATESFVAHRTLLLAVAYEMLGSAADARHVLQEVWLRWVEVDREQVRDDHALLVRITTRLSIDRLRTIERRKESAVGPRVSDPLLTAPDAEDLELAESASMATMKVLETLSPVERSVFVLRKAFGFEYDEIAAALDHSPAAVRQIAHCARRHVAARRLRESVRLAEVQEAAESLHRAINTGEVQNLLDVFAPDVVLVTDGGGLERAALRPIVGAASVIRYVSGGILQGGGVLSGDLTVINGSPAVLVSVDGIVDGRLAMRVEEGRVTGMYYVRYPEKLTRVGTGTPSSGAGTPPA